MKLDLKCSPVLVESLINYKVTDISCGQFHTIVLTHDGEAFAWGSNKFGQCGSSSEQVLHQPELVNFQKYYKPHLRAINSGGNHSGFIDDLGRLFMCGKNDFG